VTVIPDESVICDRSLESSRFRGAFGYVPPSWSTMLGELAYDLTRAAS
jgi:dTDP-4-dehydrorhamnose reductase